MSSAGRGRARPDDRNDREPSYDRDRQPPSRDRGRDRGGDRGHPDDYDRGGDREQDYDREQGRQDYDEEYDEEYDDRYRSPPSTRGDNRPGYDRDDGYGSRDRRDSHGRGDGGRDDYYGRDGGRDARRRDSRDRDRATPDYSKHRSSSMAEIARGMSERQEMASTLGSILISLVDFGLHVGVAIFMQMYHYGEHQLFWAFICLALLSNLVALVGYVARNVDSIEDRDGNLIPSDLQLKFKQRPEECVLVLMLGIVSTESLCFLSKEQHDHKNFTPTPTPNPNPAPTPTPTPNSTPNPNP